MIQKKRKNKAQGRILEILEKSPLEKRNPVCSSFPQCGGCMYQTMSYEEQLKMKDRQDPGTSGGGSDKGRPGRQRGKC